eukprot:scpid82425/ scgid30752/ Hematopoietic prostaglandin D synthase; GST class-sigma; Glutathione S-transferase; Glutathione-dependent PGD synthase; Glutathione-requiring prostaglandin D synthase; Prostaglandin-H2 D-isomerase
MPTYKLTYFDATGRAELSRRMFKLAGVEFEDVRVSKDEWPKLKAGMPLKVMPVMEVDGQLIVQSGCIERYVAEKTGLNGGESPAARLQVDIIHTTAMEYILLPMPMFGEKDEAKKAELRREFLEDKLPVCMDFLTKELEQAKQDFGSDEFFVGKVTMADIAVSLLLEVLVWAKLADDVMPKYPLIQALVDRVNALPPIAKHLANTSQK